MRCFSSGLAAALCLVAAAPALAQPFPEGKDVEMHAVGIYEGSTRTGERIHGEECAVHLDRPGARVVLVLSSYEQCTWRVEVAKGTTLERVVLAGYGQQRLASPAGVLTTHAFRGGERADEFLYLGHEKVAKQFREELPALCAMTGLTLSSFQGVYAWTGEDEPLQVHAVEVDPQLDPDFPRPADPKELPALKLPVLAGGALETWSLTGPAGGEAVALRGSAVALAPAGDRLYGLTRDGLCSIDPKTGVVTALPCSMDVPSLSWPSGVAWDSKRSRALLSAQEYLYAFDPTTTEWTVLKELDRGADLLCGLAYSAAEDLLYGLASDFGEEGRLTLVAHDPATGAEKRRTRLAPELFADLSFGRGASSMQLVSVERTLALVVDSSGGPDARRGEGRERRVYWLDPAKGSVTLTYRAR